MTPAVKDTNIAYYQNVLAEIYEHIASEDVDLEKIISRIFLLDCFNFFTNDVTAQPFRNEPDVFKQAEVITRLAFYHSDSQDLHTERNIPERGEFAAWWQLLTWTPARSIDMKIIEQSTVLSALSDVIQQWVHALSYPGRLSADEWTSLVQTSQPGLLRAFSVAAMSMDVAELPDVAVAGMTRYLYRMDATRQRSLVAWSSLVVESHKPSTDGEKDVSFLEDPLVTACLSLLDVFLEGYSADKGPTASQQALLNSALDALEVTIYPRNN
ncbi:MAG: hypothetical protein MUC47_05050 [Candidatus Kapabacteria bacterium]|jgi:hypothetical protein|nr:hypothetical protein [Candidatus Kapabacteria bacterium]